MNKENQNPNNELETFLASLEHLPEDVNDQNENGAVAENALKQKTAIALKALRMIEQNLASVVNLLDDGTLPKGASGHTVPQAQFHSSSGSTEGRVVEGVFDGVRMVGADGKVYTVPANYASKSKLVEGDMLKLTITPESTFIFKQIGPAARERVTGVLGFDETINEWYATVNDCRYTLLKASVTFFKGEVGDEAVLIVTKNAPSKYAAVEHIIKS